MSVLRITRFTADPADVPAMLARRSALIDAVRATYTGLDATTLARVDERTWLDLWTWRSRHEFEVGSAGGVRLPEAGAAFALVSDATVEIADVHEPDQTPAAG